MEELHGGSQAADNDSESENFRITVVGQTTTKPRAVKIPVDRS